MQFGILRGLDRQYHRFIVLLIWFDSDNTNYVILMYVYCEIVHMYIFNLVGSFLFTYFTRLDGIVLYLVWI